ncbi:hypothetical protein B7R22_06080 [Subtercola boreus]|uniref:Protein activator of alkane oxidation PraB n=1 Tax=Subtercola boreus TaxID=120213 RepID=A0A3E0W2C2_9MICO|nr:hypothetical protein [Subtercola boreus]RFA15653.1 hypothetical protein B7R22_06080 [Subtercola boreus]
MFHLSQSSDRRIAGAVLASVTALTLAFGVGATAAHAGPVAPPVVGYTYASFVVPTRAQNGGAEYLPVQGLVSGAGSSFSLTAYSAKMICNGVSFYPLNLTTFGGGSFSFSGLVPLSETGHACIVTANSTLPGQMIQFQPSQTWTVSELLPTAVVNISAQIINHTGKTGGL